MEIVTKVMEKSWKSHGNLLVKMCTNPGLLIAWVLVMFSLVREMRDCCANQQCNVSVENYRFFKTLQLRAWLQIYM